MGAWATGSFDNDTACDWASGLEGVADLSLVRDTLAQVIEVGEDYLDADMGSEALAACEVVARLKGNWGPRNSYTETVDKWVKMQPQVVSANFVQTAVAVIDRVLTAPSELLELWEEGDGAEWQNAVKDLRNRVLA